MSLRGRVLKWSPDLGAPWPGAGPLADGEKKRWIDFLRANGYGVIRPGLPFAVLPFVLTGIRYRPVTSPDPPTRVPASSFPAAPVSSVVSIPVGHLVLCVGSDDGNNLVIAAAYRSGSTSSPTADFSPYSTAMFVYDCGSLARPSEFEVVAEGNGAGMMAIWVEPAANSTRAGVCRVSRFVLDWR